MNIGDNITFEGIHKKVKNGKRRWWQIWKPKYIAGPLQVFKVVNIYPPLKTRVWEDEIFKESLK